VHSWSGGAQVVADAVYEFTAEFIGPGQVVLVGVASVGVYREVCHLHASQYTAPTQAEAMALSAWSSHAKNMDGADQLTRNGNGSTILPCKLP